ncbi:MAG: hypothetical protein Rhob2KO_54120 [Rhodopirellula baltica]
MVDVETVLALTVEHYGVEVSEYCGFRSGAGGRDLAAYLCRRHTSVTLRELSGWFGFSHPDGAAGLVKRVKAKLAKSRQLQADVNAIERKLRRKTEDQV